MKIAFQMDPMESIKFESDSTWQMMMEGGRRGKLYHYTPNDLCWQNGKVMANVREIYIESNISYKFDDYKLTDLAEMDIIFIRQDPPYDMGYLTTTYLLEKISHKVLMINNPTAIRNFPEKLSILDYPDLIPATFITSNKSDARIFASNYNKVVIKPLYSYAGSDVFCVPKGDLNFNNIIDNLIQIHKSPVIIQEFIPLISQGDKRIILVDGDPIGAFMRVPKQGDIRANLACGGKAERCEISEKDIEICKSIKPKLIENGLFFVGIDVIAGYLTEINITSPTGLVQIQKYSNPNIVSDIWDRINRKI